MVNSVNLKFKDDEPRDEFLDIPLDVLKWSGISLSEVLNKKDLRLEASVFKIEAKHAREILKRCKWKVKNLCGEEGFVSNSFYPGRFKRIYVDKKYGVPFFMPAQVNEIYPKPVKFISIKTQVNFDELKLKKGDILLTRSGTIGNCTIVTKTIENGVFSDDVIRISLKNENEIGYVYTFLKSKIGNLLINTDNYGAVVSHIEPDHLINIPIPDPESKIKEKIHHLINLSFILRDESNDLIDRAQALLTEELKLPPIEKFEPSYFDKKTEVKNFKVKLSSLSARIDGSYHLPIVNSIVNYLKKHAEEVTVLGDERISQKIILPGRFKRVYVEEGQGVVFFGGKQLYELDPSNKKYLSLIHHQKRIKDELTLKENMILITCSGTIGKIALVPKHWEDWTANQHIIRIVPFDNSLAGYIYTWLSSDYGHELIKRFTYGAVVDEVDGKHVSQIQIPLLKNQGIQNKINALVLEANKKRNDAYIYEQKAFKTLDGKVLYAE